MKGRRSTRRIHGSSARCRQRRRCVGSTPRLVDPVNRVVLTAAPPVTTRPRASVGSLCSDQWSQAHLRRLRASGPQRLCLELHAAVTARTRTGEHDLRAVSVREQTAAHGQIPLALDIRRRGATRAACAEKRTYAPSRTTRPATSAPSSSIGRSCRPHARECPWGRWRRRPRHRWRDDPQLLTM